MLHKRQRSVQQTTMPTAIDKPIDEIMASDDDLDDEDDGESVASDEAAAALSKLSLAPAAGDVHELIAELMNINDDDDESVASDGEYCDCLEEDSDDSGGESDHEPSSSPPTRFRRLSRVRKKDVQAEEESSSSSRIILRTNELVRKKISPPFMTASHSREELRLSCYQEEEVLALGKYDCGCTLHANGCYGMILALFVQVHGPSAYEKLINQRRKRFEVVDSHEQQWFTRVRAEVIGFIKLVGPGTIAFEYKISETRVCRDAYRFFTSLPHQSLYNIENDAEAGVTKSKWMTKAIMSEGAGVLEKAKGPTEAAIGWIETDINNLAEEQPNVDPRDTCDDDVSEIDPSCLSAWIHHLAPMFGCSPRLDPCASPCDTWTHRCWYVAFAKRLRSRSVALFTRSMNGCIVPGFAGSLRTHRNAARREQLRAPRLRSQICTPQSCRAALCTSEGTRVSRVIFAIVMFQLRSLVATLQRERRASTTRRSLASGSIAW